MTRRIPQASPGLSRSSLGFGILLIALLPSCATFKMPFTGGESVPVNLGEARALRESGELLGALASLDRQLDRASLPEERARIQYERGLCYVELGSDTRALEAFRASRSWSKDKDLNAAAEIEIGWCYLRSEHFGLSKHYFERALRSGTPRHYSLEHLRYHLAVICQNLGDREGAEAYYALAQEYRPRPGDRWVYRVESEPEAESPRGGVPTAGGALVTRDRWGARSLKNNWDPMGKIVRLTIHHTATEAPSEGLSANQDAVRRIQRFHQGSRGWADIGYHFLIDPEGRVFEGRALTVQGAHVGGDSNQGNLGIALIGSFESKPPTAPQVRSLRGLVGDLCRRFNIPASGVFTHRQFARAARKGGTECPGPHVERVVFQLRKDLVGGAASALAKGSTRPRRHVVRRGESLYGIARRYGANVKEIVVTNDIATPDRIRTGEILVIPASSP